MTLLLVLSGSICLISLFFYLRLLGDIRSLSRQLDEINAGSQIELTVFTRQKTFLALCRRVNRVLSSKDQSHARYEQAEKLLKRNITNLAHDIRTPLTGASGYLQLARECGDACQKDRYLLSAGRRLTEMEEMLEELFLFTKLTNEDFSFPAESLKAIQVLPLLGDCLLNFYSRFEEKGYAPEIIFRSENCRIAADQEALRRIFLNLIQNALLHGSGGLVISQKEISGEDVLSWKLPQTATATENPFPAGPSSLCCIIFENPVPPETVLHPEQIFDRFYKADSARGKGSSGLGLFIVKELTHRMNGAVRAETENGLLRIYLVFPAS